MRIQIDDTNYTLHVSDMIELYRYLYTQASDTGIELQDGTKFTFNRDSLLRTGLKVLMTPFVIPFIRNLYKQRSLDLVPPVKHQDLIDYSVHALLDYVKIAGINLHVDFTSRTDEGGGKTIETVATSWNENETRDSIPAIDAPAEPVANTIE